MDPQKLVTAGLQPLQAEAYALLLEKGAIAPPHAAKLLKLTRSNAYKVLDKLVELGLAQKSDQNKKIIYQPNNPLALTQLVMEARNQVVSQEEAVKALMDQLLEQYYEKTEQPTVTTVTGKDAVIQAYRQQIDLRRPLYFIRSRADITAMGFDTMHDIRMLPSQYGQNRFGITPDVQHGPINPEGDVRSNLTRTWFKHEDYIAPVEWSVSGSMLLIVLFGNEPHAIVVNNPAIANAFTQLWQMLDNCLRAMSYYEQLPRTNNQID
jgi:predicted transcriptional regulator